MRAIKTDVTSECEHSRYIICTAKIGIFTQWMMYYICYNKQRKNDDITVIYDYINSIYIECRI